MISSDVEQHVMYRIGNAPIRNYPYPHFYLENVFPEGFYAEILGHLPPLEAYQPLAETGLVGAKRGSDRPYKDRHTMLMGESELARFDPPDRGFWTDVVAWLQSEEVIRFVLQKFASLVKQRFKESLDTATFYPEFQLVRDSANYSLGPHSDHPTKVAVLIFYLPATADNPHLGTSIYVPKDPTFRCQGGPHYPRERFKKVVTMEYKPNSVFGFLKTSNSFHGVEPVAGAGARRDLIQLSVYHAKDDR